MVKLVPKMDREFHMLLLLLILYILNKLVLYHNFIRGCLCMYISLLVDTWTSLLVHGWLEFWKFEGTPLPVQIDCPVQASSLQRLLLLPGVYLPWRWMVPMLVHAGCVFFAKVCWRLAAFLCKIFVAYRSQLWLLYHVIHSKFVLPRTRIHHGFIYENRCISLTRYETLGCQKFTCWAHFE